jgi:hypothetical protein
MNNLRLPLLLLALVPALLRAAPPPQSAREIEQLIAVLEQSRCEFQRNGTWHPGNTAADHLRRKYDWLKKRDMVASAEQFIERAGTRSSMSGRAYQVRCPGQSAVPSADWLRARLLELRRRSHNPN